MTEPLIASLLAALEARPDDVPLRLHLATLLADSDSPQNALPHITLLLNRDPDDQAALDLLARATRKLAGTQPTEPADADPAPRHTGDAFDWSAAEDQVADLAPLLW